MTSRKIFESSLTRTSADMYQTDVLKLNVDDDDERGKKP